MLKSFLVAGLAAAAFVPSLASAQSQCQEQKHDNRVVGTVIGAGLGALLGNAVSSHGGKPGGTIIGGVGGAVVGNQIAGSGTHCGENQYGYYDTNGQWIPRTATAYGYYGPDGQWVANPPAGPREGGYAQGYQQGGPNPGYGPPPPAPAYGRDAAYSERPAGRMDFREREDRMDQMIRQEMSDGRLDDREGRHALRDLADIRRMEGDYRQADGHMNDDQRADIDHRLDALRDRIHGDNGGPAPRPY